MALAHRRRRPLLYYCAITNVCTVIQIRNHPIPVRGMLLHLFNPRFSKFLFELLMQSTRLLFDGFCGIRT